MPGGQHGKPTTGDGRKGGKKPAKSQITQRNASGTNLVKQTAKLWGILSGKKSK